MGTATAARMTSDEKAEVFGPLIVWGLLAGRADAVSCLSPASGSEYRVSAAGTCTCEGFRRWGRCYHLTSLILEYGSVAEGVADLTRSVRVAVPAHPPAPRREQPGMTAKAWAADWR